MQFGYGETYQRREPFSRNIRHYNIAKGAKEIDPFYPKVYMRV